MISPAVDDASPLDVVIVRNDDLEGRELMLFDRLHRQGLIRARAVGARPRTPYGLGDLAFPVQLLPSVLDQLGRIPLGGTAGRVLEDRAGRPVGHLIGFDRALGPDVRLINARETSQPSTLLACRYARTHPKARVVVSVVENLPFRYEDSDGLARVKDEVRNHADLFVANSPEARDALVLEGVPEDRVRVIPPAIDTDLFEPGAPSAALRRAWDVPDDGCAIVYAGRLVREKGIVELVVALAPRLRADASTKLVIHGAGPELGRIKRTVAALGLTRSVHFSDWIATARMPDVYRSADVVVMPSLPTPYWAEQFGFNLVEAMACQSAVVTTASGSIAWVTGGTAVLVPPYDGPALADAISALVDSPSRRAELGRRARRHATETYAVDRAGRDLVEAFREAMDRPPR